MFKGNLGEFLEFKCGLACEWEIPGAMVLVNLHKFVNFISPSSQRYPHNADSGKRLVIVKYA